MTSVYLIILDSVRKDYFKDYAPRLQEMADIRSNKTYAASSWSVPSHPSMLTGQLPHEHGVHTYSREIDMPKEDMFHQNIDVESFGISSNPYISNAFGYDSYFDEFWDVSPRTRFPKGMDIQEWIENRDTDSYDRFIDFGKEVYSHNHSVKSILNGIYLKMDQFARKNNYFEKITDDGASGVLKQFSRSISDKPQFGIVNIMDVHSPLNPTKMYNSTIYDVPKTWGSYKMDSWDIMVSDSLSTEQEQHIEYYRDLYAASVDYVDRKVSKWIKDHKDEDSTFIITADHGENLCYNDVDEDGLFGHTSSLSQSLVNVPFYIINPPHKIETNGLISHLDLPKIIESIFNESFHIPNRETIPIELIGYGNYEPESDPKYWDRSIRACIKQNKKVVWDTLGGRNEIDLEKMEKRDLNKIPEWCESQFKVDISEAKSHCKDNHTDLQNDEVQKRLERLGYK